MTSSELISPEGSGYRVVKLADLGEIHIEFSNRPDQESQTTLWEASIYSPEGHPDLLRTIMYVIAYSRDELVRELDRALFFNPGID